MASIKRRNSGYQVQIRRKGFPQVSKAFTSLTGANGGCNICDGSGFVKGNSVAPVGSFTWKLDEGIAGSREDNKKMRGQLWGDMRNRGRGR